MHRNLARKINYRFSVNEITQPQPGTKRQFSRPPPKIKSTLKQKSTVRTEIYTRPPPGKYKVNLPGYNRL